MKYAGVFSGGGSFGSYTVGLLNKNKPTYDITYGCSTGSLIAPFAVLGEWDLLRDCYTNVTQDKIFKVSPFYNNGLPNLFIIIKRLIFNKTIGDTSKLFDLIKSTFKIEHYNKIKELGKDVCIVVTNITDKDNPCEYKYLSKETYEDFCFYMWASTCVPAVCSLPIKNNVEYADGGITDVVPLIKALDDNVKNIDIFTYDYPDTRYRSNTKNSIHLLTRCYKIMRNQIYNVGFDSLKMLYDDKNIIIKRYNPPYKLSDNALIFDKEKMTEWYNLGYNS